MLSVVAAVVEDCVAGKLGCAADCAYLAVLDEERCGLCALRCDDAVREERMCHNLIIP